MTEAPPSVHRTHVFVSFAYEDTSAAALIARSLQQDFTVELGLPTLTQGGPPASALREAIQSSDVVVVLLSRAAWDSEQFRAETAVALNLDSKRRDIDLVPVLLEPCKIPEGLRDRLAVDLSQDGALGVKRLITRLLKDRAVDFKALDHLAFERLVYELLRHELFDIAEAPQGKDHGYDFAGSHGGEHWVVEVKHYSRQRLSVSAIHQIMGMISDSPGTNALLVTSSQLTSVASKYLKDASSQLPARIRVIDGVELKQLLAKHPALIDYYFATDRPRHG